MMDRAIKKGFTVIYGGGFDIEDMWYDEYFYKGSEAKEFLQPQYGWIKAELRKRKPLF